jgi:hypothetical protein
MCGRLAFNLVMDARPSAIMRRATADHPRPALQVSGPRRRRSQIRRMQRTRAKTSATARRNRRSLIGPAEPGTGCAPRREQLEIEQRQEIDGAELAVPGRRRGNARANGQVGLQQLGNLDLKQESVIGFDRLVWQGDGCACAPPARWGRRTPRSAPSQTPVKPGIAQAGDTSANPPPGLGSSKKSSRSSNAAPCR